MKNDKPAVYLAYAVHRCLELGEGVIRGTLEVAKRAAEELYRDIDNIDIHISRKRPGEKEDQWEPVLVRAKGGGCRLSEENGNEWKEVVCV